MSWTRVSKIRRKFIASVFAAVVPGKTKSYSFDDMYGSERNEGVDPKWIEKELWGHDYSKLYYDGPDADGNAKYVVYLHSNCNYDFTSTIHPEVKK